MSTDRSNEKSNGVFARQPRALTPEEMAAVSGGSYQPALVTGPKDGGGTDNESRADRH